MSIRHLPQSFAATLLLTCAVMLGGCGTAPKVQNPEYRTLSERPDRKIVQLDNGLVVMAQRIPTAPVASVQCWVKTGSIYEAEYNGAGLSHFLEHLVSGGTTSTRTEAESSRILGQIGAQVNAATSLDTVRYYINTSAENAPTAISLISDWMRNSEIPQDQFERERQVIQREFAMGRGEPGRILWKLTQLARYRSHPAKHPTIGYLDEFLEITRDQIYDFYKRMYVPNNMVFVVTGQIDPDLAVERVVEQWRDAQRQDVPAVIFPDEPPLQEAREMVGYADVDRPRLRLAWPGTQLGAEGDYALDLLAQVLGQGELSRLVQTVRDEMGLVTSIDAYNASFAWGEGFFGVDAVIVPGQMEKAKRAITEVIDRLQVIGITPEELERAKSKTIAQVVYATQTAQAAAARLAGDFLHTGDPDYMERYTEAIEEISIAEVQAAAREYLQPDRLITIQLLPQEGTPPQLVRPEVEPTDPRLGRAADVELVELGNAELVERMMSLRDVDSEQIHLSAEPGPIRMHTLPNGLRLITQRNPRLPIAAMQWYHLGGLMADEYGQEGVANAMAQMMIKGADDRTADEIARTLEDLGAQLSTDCGSSTFVVSGQCLSDDVPEVLSLMADVIQRPTFPADEWAQMQPRLLAMIDSLDDVWHSQLRNTFREGYFGDHPWSQPTVGRRGVVESITPERLAQFHESHFSASNGVLAVFGDIDEDQVVQRVTELMGELPRDSEVSFEALEHEPIEPRIVQVQSGKPLAAVQIGYGPGMARDNPDYASMLVMTSVLDAFPVGWLSQALRGEGPGLVYAVGAGMMTGVAPGYWAILFNTRPETLTEAMTRALEVVDRIRSEPVDSATLERARTAVLVREALTRQTNSQRASDAALNELYGVGYDAADRLIQEIRAVDAAAIHNVANRYLQTPVAAILTLEPVDEATLPPLQEQETEQAATTAQPEPPAEEQTPPPAR